MPKKIEEYEEAKGVAWYVATHTFMLPFKIVIFGTKITAKGLRAVLSAFFRDNNIEDVGTTIDPDKDGVWIRKR